MSFQYFFNVSVCLQNCINFILFCRFHDNFFYWFDFTPVEFDNQQVFNETYNAALCQHQDISLANTVYFNTTVPLCEIKIKSLSNLARSWNGLFKITWLKPFRAIDECKKNTLKSFLSKNNTKIISKRLNIAWRMNFMHHVKAPCIF